VRNLLVYPEHFGELNASGNSRRESLPRSISASSTRAEIAEGSPCRGAKGEILDYRLGRKVYE